MDENDKNNTNDDSLVYNSPEDANKPEKNGDGEVYATFSAKTPPPVNESANPYAKLPKSKKKKSKKSLVLIFLAAFVAAILLFAVIVTSAYYIWIHTPLDDMPEIVEPAEPDVSGNIDPDEPIESDYSLGNLPGSNIPRKTNLLVLGIDDEADLADVIMILSYDHLTGKVDALSIPRDTRIRVTEQINEIMKEKIGKTISGEIKINSVSNVVGDEYRAYFYELVLESYFRVKMNYYVEIDIAAFRGIVEAVGGIEMEIRPQGLHYTDEKQGLYINVPGGWQRLNGEMAEGVVRFREYRMGDIDRIDVRHQFMKAFFSQVLTRDAIMNDPIKFISSIITNVKTDFDIISDGAKYLPVLNALNGNSFEFKTLDGYALPPAEGAYFIFYRDQAEAYLKETILNYDVPDSESIGNDKTKTICVMNGTDTPDAAENAADMLKDKGFNAVSGEAYLGTQAKETRIVVKDETYGLSLVNFFKNAVVQVDGNVQSDYDIVIILGTDDEQ